MVVFRRRSIPAMQLEHVHLRESNERLYVVADKQRVPRVELGSVDFRRLPKRWQAERRALGGLRGGSAVGATSLPGLPLRDFAPRSARRSSDVPTETRHVCAR
jgi:hypothetical protein